MGKTIIIKKRDNLYLVNGVAVERHFTGEWRAKEPLTIEAMLDFKLFVKYGNLDEQQKLKKINKLELQYQQLQAKLLKTGGQLKGVLLGKLYKINRQLAELNFGVVVYE